MENRKSQNQPSSDAVERDSGVSPQAQSVVLAERGLNTTDAISKFLGAVISDMLQGDVPAKVANPCVLAAGKMLKALELKHRFGAGKDLKVF